MRVCKCVYVAVFVWECVTVCVCVLLCVGGCVCLTVCMLFIPDFDICVAVQSASGVYV